MAPTIRAALLCDGNPRDILHWSGTPFHMLQALEPHFEIALVVEQPWARWYRLIGPALKVLSGHRYQYTASRWFTKLASGRTRKQLTVVAPDIIIAISARSLAHTLTQDFRVVYIADATVHSMINYFPSFTYSPSARKGAEDMEAKTILGSMLSLYPSSWARESAIRDYGARADKVLELPWGANIRTKLAGKRTLPNGPLRFLFVGVEWVRKGGPLALATVASLTSRGVDCRLDIVGCNANVMANNSVPRNVHFHGFLSKNRSADEEELSELFALATFFLLPTRADCFPMVFAEAASQGIPTVSIATGGVSSAIISGVTGILLQPGVTGAEVAAAVLNIVRTPERYTQMSQAAIDDASQRLNWKVWACSVERVVRTALTQVDAQ